MLVMHSQTYFDAVFQHIEGPEPHSVQDARYKMIGFLARYGRQSVLQWKNVEVNELAHHFEVLLDMIRQENALTSKNENS